MIGETSAPAKVILFGEHAVVYGIPAIAIPVSSLRAYATVEETYGSFQLVADDLKYNGTVLSVVMGNASNPLTRIVELVLHHFDAPLPHVKITLRSDIPIASGLGSGAAVSATLGRAIALAIHRDIPDEKLNRLVYEIEKIHHGTPSGIDNTVIVYEQPIYFVRDKAIKRLQINSPFHIVVADTGQTALTHLAVGDVRKLYEANPTIVQSQLDKIGEIVKQAMACLMTGNLKQLGLLMTENHKYLQALTVSSPELDVLVETALNTGALGAKLSGGGRGGNMIALVDETNIEDVKSALLSAGAVRVFDSTVQ